VRDASGRTETHDFIGVVEGRGNLGHERSVSSLRDGFQSRGSHRPVFVRGCPYKRLAVPGSGSWASCFAAAARTGEESLVPQSRGLGVPLSVKFH